MPADLHANFARLTHEPHTAEFYGTLNNVKHEQRERVLLTVLNVLDFRVTLE